MEQRSRSTASPVPGTPVCPSNGREDSAFKAFSQLVCPQGAEAPHRAVGGISDSIVGNYLPIVRSFTQKVCNVINVVETDIFYERRWICGAKIHLVATGNSATGRPDQRSAIG